jgi:hypothetical protein
MSAVAKNYAYVFKKKKKAPPIPVMSREQLEAFKANVAKNLVKKF